MAAYSQNLVGCLIDFGANTGTPSSTNVDLYAVDANGLPTGSSLANASLTPAGSAIATVTFSTAYAVTAGTCYAIIASNKNASPTTNYATPQNSTTTYNGMLQVSSANSGSTWAGSHRSYFICAPTYSSAGSDGYLAGTSLSFAASNGLFNVSGSRTSRCGILVNFPHDVLLWRVAAGFGTPTGSPNYNLQAEICSATASLSVSDTQIPTVGLNNGTGVFEWYSPFRLLTGVNYYIGVTPVGATAGDSSDTAYLSTQLSLVKPATQGPIKDAYQSTTSGAPNFTVLATRIFGIDLYVEVAGSSTPVTRAFGSAS